VFRIAVELLDRLPAGKRRFRLLGVAATGLVAADSEQVVLAGPDRWDGAERAMDEVERRFGRGAAVPATLLGPASPRKGPGPMQPHASG
jgi:hypothetical protein